MYSSDLKMIQERVNEYNHDYTHFASPHIESLYPREALSILSLSRSCHWPETVASVDSILDAYLGHWIRVTRPKLEQYAENLFSAIRQRKCENGVYARLSLLVFEKMPDRVVGRHTGSKVIQIDRSQAKKDIKAWLARQNAFRTNLRMLNQELETIDRSYDLEQILLSWMGFVVLRSMANGGDLIPPLLALPDKRELRPNRH